MEVSKDLVIARVLNAPLEQVWKAWTEPEHIMNWWGPKDFTAPVIKIDFRVGGKFLFCMQSPEGEKFWSTGVYREIVPMSRIVCTNGFADPEGNLVPASYYKMDGDWPLEPVLRVSLEDHEGKTKLTVRHSGIPVGTMLEMAEQGWNQQLDKLDASMKLINKEQ